MLIQWPRSAPALDCQPTWIVLEWRHGAPSQPCPEDNPLIIPRSIRAMLAGTLLWTLLMVPGQAKLLEERDPTDPEVLVSIRMLPGDAPAPLELVAEYWVSRPEMVAVTLMLGPGGARFPRSGSQSPPLLIDGKRLSARPCFTTEPSPPGSGARLHVSLSMAEFAQLVQAKRIEGLHGEAPSAVPPEQRAALREFWDRLRPLVQDPAFRAHALLREGSKEAIATLLRGGWNPNRLTYMGRPPLGVVAAQGNLEGVNVLLQAGAKLDGVDGQGHTALHHAILQGHSDLALELLDRGASLTQTDRTGATPLHLAIQERNALVVQGLLERGAAPNVANAAGLTALHVALLAPPAASRLTPAERWLAGIPEPASTPDLIATLLRFGADPRMPIQSSLPELRDVAGLSAIEVAQLRDDPALIGLLANSPLVSAASVRDLANDLASETAAEALALLQARIRILSPLRLLRDYCSLRYQAALDRVMQAGGYPASEAAYGRDVLAERIRRALDPRGATLTLGPDSVTVTRRIPGPAGEVTRSSRVGLVKEAGVWKLDRIEPVETPEPETQPAP